MTQNTTRGQADAWLDSVLLAVRRLRPGLALLGENTDTSVMADHLRDADAALWEALEELDSLLSDED